MQLGRLVVVEIGEQLLHGQSRVDDIFDHHDGAIFNVLGEADELFDLAGALHALVLAKRHKRNFCGNVDAAHEVGGKHEGAVGVRRETKGFFLRGRD